MSISKLAVIAALGSTLAFRAAADEGQDGITPGAGPTSASGRIKVAEKDYDEESGTFSIAFTDGSAADVALDSLPASIVRLLALHGLSQKLGDSYASVKGDVAEAKRRFEAVLTQLQAGEWKKARESGEGGSKVTELAEAISKFKNAPLEKAIAVVAKATPEQLKQWRANTQLKAIIAQIRAEKAAARAAAAEAKAAESGEASPADDGLDGLDLSDEAATA